ncbi:MAG TPA: peptidyl-prolyl cis-trans isomerase [Anaeromyxobacteraceae bacterium]|nr:peptidyl-prolyl cis-trans isomerase [Anaeromyxobacteraceae bacterium]
MRARALAVLATVLAAACGRCGGAASRSADPGARTVALVNGQPITAEAIRRELDQSIGGSATMEGDPAVARRRVLEDLVDRALLLQEARTRSIVVGEDQVERSFLRIRSEYPGSHFDDLLAKERLSQSELRARLKEQLTIEKLFHDEVFPQLRVTDAEVERYYTDHAAEFQAPEAVRVSQIVVATREEAASVRDRLRRDPQGFADLARRTSIAPEGRNGGDLGYIVRGAGFPEVFDLCFSLPKNVVSDVTPSPYGFHLFKVTDKRPAQRQTLEQVRGQILERLNREKRARAQVDYLATLRKRTPIEIDEKALATVNP